MLDAVAGRGTLSLFDGTHETKVVGFGDGLLLLAEEIANRTGRFLLIWQRGADRIEMPFSGSVRDDGRSVALEDDPAGTLSRSLTKAGDGIGRALIETALAGEPPARKERHIARLLLRMAIVLACLGLLGYDAYKLYHASITITPSVAYLSTEVSTINAPTSGTLTFAAGPGSIAKGEPILGIENARGKTILVDATEDVRIVVQDRQVGDRVRRGEAVLAVADNNPPTYVDVVMSREEAFRLSSGAYVHYAFLHEAPTAGRTVYIAGDAFALSMLPDDSGSGEPTLYRVRFRIPEDALARTEPIVVEIQQSLADRVTTLLNGFGVAPDLVPHLISPIVWLETRLHATTGDQA